MPSDHYQTRFRRRFLVYLAFCLFTFTLIAAIYVLGDGETASIGYGEAQVIILFLIFAACSCALFWLLLRSLARIHAREDELQTSLTLLDTFCEKSPFLLYLKNLDGVFLYANEATRRVCGVTQNNQILGKTDYDLIPRHLAESLEAQRRLVQREVAPHEFNHSFFSDRRQKVCYYKTRKFPLLDKNGVVYAVGSMAEEVTDRKIAENRLRESEEKFRAVLESAPDAILLSGQDGNIQLANDQAAILFGYSLEQLGNMKIEDLIDPALRDKHVSLRKAFAENPATRAMGGGLKLTGVSADGLQIPVEVALSPVSTGGTRLVTCIIRDISDKVRYLAEIEQRESTLNALNQELMQERASLEERVAERTRQLEQAMAVAESANNAKSSFLATMSHEIRTPLHGIIGTVEVLMQSSLKSRQLELTEIIRDSANSLLGIINDILDFSKIEAGRMELERENVNLGYLVESICNLHCPLAEKLGVRLTLFLDPELPKVIVSDETRLRQIINNLLSNAIKFSRSNDDSGLVSMSLNSAQGGRLVLTVTDNGIGMTEDVLTRILEPFVQAESSTSRRFGGTGLGLSITRHLVALMNGTLDIDSKAGAGSSFSITLPLEVASVVRESEAENLLAGHHCLLFTQDTVVRDGWIRWLEYCGALITPLSDSGDLERALASRQHGALYSLLVVADRDFSGPFSRLIQSSPHSRALHKLILVHPDPDAGRLFFINDNTIQINRSPNLHSSFVLVKELLLSRISEDTHSAPQPDFPDLQFTSFPDRFSGDMKGRILVVDDNPVNQKVICHQLELLGHPCVLANDGVEAMALHQKHPFSLILTDVQMTGMDGYELTAAIRRTERRGVHVPIIAFTATVTVGEKQRCLGSGMDDFIAKPIALKELFKTLAKWLTPVNPQDATMSSQSHLPTEEEKLILDLAVLERNAAGNADLMQELLDDFAQLIDEHRDRFRSLACQASWEELSRLSHNFKSTARIVGAMKLGNLLSALEKETRDNNSPDVTEHIQLLDVVMAQTASRIRC